MTDHEIFSYEKLMKLIREKGHGNIDESDITQIILGALYYWWLKRDENKYDKKSEIIVDIINRGKDTK